MHTPNMSECRVNLGVQALQTGQWADLNALGIKHTLHIKFGLYKYGLIYNTLFPIFLLTGVLTFPLVLMATRA